MESLKSTLERLNEIRDEVGKISLELGVQVNVFGYPSGSKVFGLDNDESTKRYNFWVFGGTRESNYYEERVGNVVVEHESVTFDDVDLDKLKGYKE